ncbi:MAG: aminodeoxychorismate synthase component I [Brevinematia bacterium]
MVLKDDVVFIVDKQDHFLLFEKPLFEVSVVKLADLKESLRVVDEFVREKLYVCGFISYEAGYSILNLPAKAVDDRLPILWFGAFLKPKLVEVTTSGGNYSISNIGPSLDLKEYLEKVDILKRYVKDGYTYQVNFTFKLFFDFDGDPLAFFLDLRRKQRVKYARFVKYYDVYILSVSPELFFSVKGDKIVTKPMKGTIRRGRFLEEDLLLMRTLKMSEKDRAENLMITDLLRNDIGSISKFGSVGVRKMFEVERYETVFQMTSTVEGNLREGVKFSDVVINLFPGGSITGAPKRKTVEIISEVETLPRGIYTGTIGYISPNGFSEFNVAIRTPIICGSRGEMGVGSGITWYSEPEDEYKECLLKSDFLVSKPHPEFELVETILLRNHRLCLLKYHLSRLKKSAEYFSFRYNRKVIIEKLRRVAELGGKFKLRLLLSREGRVRVEVKKFETVKKRGFVRLSEDRVDSKNKFLYHKTTNREVYDYYTRKAREERLVDYVFLNEDGYVTEGSINNIIIFSGGKFITPDRRSGLLRGTMLEYLSRKYGIVEEFITLRDLLGSERVFMCNSVSGIKEVKVII